MFNFYVFCEIFFFQEFLNILIKENLLDPYIHEFFRELFGSLVLFYRPVVAKRADITEEMNFARVKAKLWKTQRKLEYKTRDACKISVSDVFDLSSYCPNDRLRKKLEKFDCERSSSSKNRGEVIVGRTNLLLPVLIKKTQPSRCINHVLTSYNV